VRSQRLASGSEEDRQQQKDINKLVSIMVLTLNFICICLNYVHGFNYCSDCNGFILSLLSDLVLPLLSDLIFTSLFMFLEIFYFGNLFLSLHFPLPWHFYLSTGF
jgi:hypothetical protein